MVLPHRTGAPVAIAIAVVMSPGGGATIGCVDARFIGASDPVDASGGSAATSETEGSEGIGACPSPSSPPSEGTCLTLGTDGGGPPAPGGGEVGGCNPVTGEPCAMEETCDAVYAPVGEELLGFRCFDGPNDAAECASCNEFVGPWCENGTSCFMGECRGFCCETEDCGPDASCVIKEGEQPLFPGEPQLGLCLSTQNP